MEIKSSCYEMKINVRSNGCWWNSNGEAFKMGKLRGLLFFFFFFRMAQGSWGPHLCSPFEVLQMLQLVGASEKEIF